MTAQLTVADGTVYQFLGRSLNYVLFEFNSLTLTSSMFTQDGWKFWGGTSTWFNLAMILQFVYFSLFVSRLLLYYVWGPWLTSTIDLVINLAVLFVKHNSLGCFDVFHPLRLLFSTNCISLVGPRKIQNFPHVVRSTISSISSPSANQFQNKFRPSSWTVRSLPRCDPHLSSMFQRIFSQQTLTKSFVLSWVWCNCRHGTIRACNCC